LLQDLNELTAVEYPDDAQLRACIKALKENHSRKCVRVDKPIAGLLKDLKRRGMLDETLVVWATEFGRTPGGERSDGREHFRVRHPSRSGDSKWRTPNDSAAGVFSRRVPD